MIVPVNVCLRWELVYEGYVKLLALVDQKLVNFFRGSLWVEDDWFVPLHMCVVWCVCACVGGGGFERPYA